MKSKGSIGVFDSGYGGLTVLSELIHYLPDYDFIYLGDNARAPYGTRSFDVVYKYTLQAVRELFDQGCPLVILACNTASAKALRTIQQHDLPELAPDRRVLGVIRPSTEVLGSLTTSGNVGILATQGTVKSESYLLELHKFSPEVKVFQQACPMWVPLIESNEHFSKPGKKFIRKDVQKLLEQSAKIDTILLGCTHYPIVEAYLREIVPPSVRIVSQGEIVAKSLVDYLDRHPEMNARLNRNGQLRYLTSGDTETFDEKALELMGLQVMSERIHF